MARTKTPATTLRHFKKGQSGNPNGRPKLLGDRLSRFNKQDIVDLINKIVRMDLSQIKEHMVKPGVPTLDLMVCRVVSEAISKGDQTRLNFLFDRIIGKVKETVEVSVPKPTVIKLIGQEAALVIGALKNDDTKSEWE